MVKKEFPKMVCGSRKVWFQNRHFSRSPGPTATRCVTSISVFFLDKAVGEKCADIGLVAQAKLALFHDLRKNGEPRK